jgi:hypothetical protein
MARAGVYTGTMNPTRCTWANMANPRYLAYHDNEWGVPCHDETTLFEMLNLEGAQAGLSWETILNKRDMRPGSPATTTPRWPRCLPTPASCATA